jgi:hypothetical protein
MVWVRNAVEQSLAGKSFVVSQGYVNKHGTLVDAKGVYLQLDQPVGEGPAWNSNASPDAKNFSLLTWTSKMNCPSWSLPAGAPDIGGACPGATGGQSVVIDGSLVPAQRLVSDVTRRPVDMSRSICQTCVTGDARVFVRGRWLVRIDELVDAGEFEVWSGVDWRLTSAVFQGVRPTVAIRTSWGAMIRVTPDHKIMTKDDGMVAAEDLEPGDCLVFQPPSEGSVVADRHGMPRVESVTPLPSAETVYDLVNVGPERQFVANGVTISNCYAFGGRYGTGLVQYAQGLRFIWARRAMLEPVMGPYGMSTLFIETMVAAIQGASFFLEGGRARGGDGEGEQRLPPEPSGRRFFRIHDSGDFFAPEYFRQWKAVCDRLPDIMFWAPSRVWAAGRKWIALVNEVNAPSPRSANNLVIRPSAYEIDQPAPAHLGPGWAAGSTVISYEGDRGPTLELVKYVESIEGKPMKMLGGGPDQRYNWGCRAYSTGSTHTCRNAVAPPGMGGQDGRGCRACWVAPSAVVNYHPH